MSAVTGCSTTGQQAQIEAGAVIGAAAAKVEMERQPDDCGEPWPVLDVPAGEDKAVTTRRYDAYILGPINQRVFNCFWFNENQRIGLQGHN